MARGRKTCTTKSHFYWVAKNKRLERKRGKSRTLFSGLKQPVDCGGKLWGGGGRSDLLFFRVWEIEVWNGFFCSCTTGKRKLGRVNRRRRRFRTGRRHPPVYLLLDRGSRSQLRSSSDPPEIEAKKRSFICCCLTTLSLSANYNGGGGNGGK